MVHRIVWRVASEDALAFWSRRLEGEGLSTRRIEDRLRFKDPEGLELELKVDDTSDEPLRAQHPDVPVEFAILGFDAAHAYSGDPERSAGVLEDTLGFDGTTSGMWEARGDRRGGRYIYDEAPSRQGLNGAGTVHHIAWACPMDEHGAWRERIAGAGVEVTPVIDRFYFRSIYFREPSGVLFEIATLGPGFTSDEPLETLGQALSLPPKFEVLRERVERELTPLPDPRERSAQS